MDEWSGEHVAASSPPVSRAGGRAVLAGPQVFSARNSVLLPFSQNTASEYITLDSLGIAIPAVPGDVDGNSSLNIYDLLEMLKVLNGKLAPEPWQQAASDIDANGRVDVFDLLALLLKLRTANTVTS